MPKISPAPSPVKPVGAPLNALDHVVHELSVALSNPALGFGGSWLRLFNSVDDDGGGEVSQLEFVGAVREDLLIDETMLSDDEVLEAWAAMDADASGVISVKEFGAFMKAHSTAAALAVAASKVGNTFQMPDDVREVLSRSMSRSASRTSVDPAAVYAGRFGGHQPGKKTKVGPAASFERGKKNFEGKVIHPVVQVMTDRITKDHDLGGSWFQLFSWIDGDSSGTIDFREFLGAMRERLCIYEDQVPDEEIGDLWGIMDTDGSNCMTVAEFSKFLRENSEQSVVGFGSKTAHYGAASYAAEGARKLAHGNGDAGAASHERVIHRIVRRECKAGRWNGKSDDARHVMANRSDQHQRDEIRSRGESPSKILQLRGPAGTAGPPPPMMVAPASPAQMMGAPTPSPTPTAAEGGMADAVFTRNQQAAAAELAAKAAVVLVPVDEATVAAAAQADAARNAAARKAAADAAASAATNAALCVNSDNTFNLTVQVGERDATEEPIIGKDLCLRVNSAMPVAWLLVEINKRLGGRYNIVELYRHGTEPDFTLNYKDRIDEVFSAGDTVVAVGPAPELDGGMPVDTDEASLGPPLRFTGEPNEGDEGLGEDVLQRAADRN